MKLIKKQVRNSIMLDLYGRLLTKKEQKIAKFYFNCDLGISEIAEELRITRQAVYFSLKNIIKDLDKYETGLELYQDYIKKKRKQKNV